MNNIYPSSTWALRGGNRQGLSLSQQHGNNDGNSFAVKCPACNAVHEYKPAQDDQKDFQVFHSEDGKSTHTMYALACGHLLTPKEFETMGGTIGGHLWDCPLCCGDEQQEHDRRCSHGARAIWIRGNEQCPVCLEDFAPPKASMIALPCGHIFCAEDFRKIGGRTGADAAFTTEDLKHQRQEQIEQRRVRHGQVIGELIESLADEQEEAPDVDNVVDILAALRDCTNCETGDVSSFLQRDGPVAIVAVLNRFPDDMVAHVAVFKLLKGLLCKDHRTPGVQTSISKGIIDAGIVNVCVRILSNEQAGVLVLKMISGLLLQPMFVSQCFLTELCTGNDMSKLKSILAPLIRAMERHPDNFTFQFLANSAFMSLTVHSGSVEYDNVSLLGHRIRNLFADLGGIEAVINGMALHGENPRVQTACIGALCHTACTISLAPKIRSLGGFTLTCTAMQNHTDVRMMQCNGINFLYSMVDASMGQDEEKEAIKEAIISNRVIQRLRGALVQFPEDNDLRLRAVRVLCVLSESEEDEILLELTTSGAIPELVQIYQHTNSVLVALVMQNETSQWTNDVDPNEVMRLRNMAKATLCALGALGVIDHGYCGDDYGCDDDDEDGDGGDDEEEEAEDFDNRGPRCKIQSPPFNVTSITDQDLLANPPGWYKLFPFVIDGKRSKMLANSEHQKEFLRVSIKPCEGQQVAICVTIPRGGRGYLYGEITEVFQAPSDEALRESGSAYFESPCRCSNPECGFKTGSRQETLEAFGAVHGQKIQATVSLQSPYFQPNLRFAPIPEFFQGEDTKYDVVIRFDDNGQAWKVTHISKH